MREYPKYKKVLFCTDFSENRIMPLSLPMALQKGMTAFCIFYT